MRARAVRLLLLTVTLLVVCAAPASAASVLNGNFEIADLRDWSSVTQFQSAASWTTYAGSTSPVSNFAIPADEGVASAIYDQNEVGGAALYQDVALQAGQSHTLNFDYFFVNKNTEWDLPDPFSYYANSPSKNQQMAIDVLKSGADPFTSNASDELAVFNHPKEADPLSSGGWQHGSLDLTPFAGQTVRLRFLGVSNEANLLIGVDDVAITSLDSTAPALSKLAAAPSAFKGKNGTTFFYSLSEPAKVTATFERASAGKKSRSKCVKSKKPRAKRKSCTFYKALAGSLAGDGREGANALDFSGKLGSKTLAKGGYRVTLVATDGSGNRSKPSKMLITVR